MSGVTAVIHTCLSQLHCIVSQGKGKGNAKHLCTKDCEDTRNYGSRNIIISSGAEFHLTMDQPATPPHSWTFSSIKSLPSLMLHPHSRGALLKVLMCIIYKMKGGIILHHLIEYRVMVYSSRRC